MTISCILYKALLHMHIKTYLADEEKQYSCVRYLDICHKRYLICPDRSSVVSDRHSFPPCKVLNSYLELHFQSSIALQDNFFIVSNRIQNQVINIIELFFMFIICYFYLPWYIFLHFSEHFISSSLTR